MNSFASAIIADRLTSSSVESGFPYLIFSNIVVGNRVMCWSTNAIDDLRDFNFHYRISVQTQLIDPPSISAKRNISRTKVVLPEPVEPTIPIVLPASIVRFSPEKIFSLLILPFDQKYSSFAQNRFFINFIYLVY